MSVIEQHLACGAAAAARLAPYERKISDNFEIPLHIGRLIAAWDRPRFVAAADANHMRDDDYVVGLGHKGQFRAYPLWVTDNYHMINDKVAGDPILFSTCERCQSGSAFISKVNGKSVKFSALGMYNASLTMANRRRDKGDQHSLWLHYEGVAIDGPAFGHFLEQLPTYHMTWRQWADLHPETDVMLAPDDPHHRDARHGHGREEFFSRPGMDPPLAKTITGSFDHRYPENELVLGINVDAGIRAYPLVEVKREGGVVHGDLGGHPIAVFSGPRPEQVSLSAFSRIAADQALTFDLADGCFKDRETGSAWSIEGEATSGPLAGQRLTPLRWQVVRWHAWVYPHPATELFLSSRPLDAYPDFQAMPQVEALRGILDELAGRGDEPRFSHAIYDLALPHEATDGISVVSGGDRLNLYAFTSEESAQDYVDLQGAWFCMPFDAKIARRRSRRTGRCVVESDPVERYAEPTQTVAYPDNEAAWSDLARDTAVTDAVEGHFAALFRFLKHRRYDVVECAFLPRSQLRVGTVAAVAATINADRFAIYRCTDDDAAASVAEEVGHAVHAGRWVLRSIPVLMYADPHYEMGQLPDDQIVWSPLLGMDTFRSDLRAFADVGSVPRP